MEISERALTSGLTNFLGIRVVLTELDHSVVQMEIKPEYLNLFGNLHGGAYLTLADHAGGWAAMSDGRRHVTQQSNMHFLQPVNHGVITAESRVIRRGRKVVVVRIDITGEDGRLLATGDYTFFCVEPGT